MKKFFTLAASLLVFTASAQYTVKNLDKSLVFYLTNDTVSTQMGIYEDPDTGEEVEGLVPRPWNGASCVSAFNACGIGLQSGTDDFGLNITIKERYSDPENGFTIPAGVYRGVTLNRARLDLSGPLNDGSTFRAFTNVKSMVLYFIPVPTTWVSGGISLQDFPTGRIEAQYLNDSDTLGELSNLAYREAHITMTADPLESDTRVIKGVDLVGFERDENDPTKIAVTQPFKWTVNLQNKKDASEYEALFADPETKQGEFVNYVISSEETEAEIEYYFGRLDECRAYYDNDKIQSTATGYSCYDHKWCTKTPWTAETPIALKVKYRMYLVGVAVMSATDGAGVQYMNAADGAKATWSDAAVAYGTHGEEGIETIANDAPKSHRIYDLNGQQLNAASGICIQDGKLIFVK